ncbi:MAG: polysaccharide deacetylase family protein [Bacteroidota bacterium]|nr:polysaccharide deacetylase family protein [Bacteroidota bacterium]
MKVLVYTEKKTSRLRYAFRLILRSVLGLEMEITEDQEVFRKYTGPRINYSQVPFEGVLTFRPAELLFERDIFEQEIYTSSFKGEVIFFTTKNQDPIPFDLFAASFYLVTRYEEYLPFIPDTHNRFTAAESLAVKEGFLSRPLVNIWADWLMDALKASYPGFEANRTPYRFISTVDVDNLYAYKGKGGFRTLSGFAKDILSFDLQELKNRVQVLTGFRKDPYDTLDMQLRLQEKYGFESIYFMLFSRFGQFDRNLPMYSPRLHAAVKDISDEAIVGIHPSYASNERFSILVDEVKSLNAVLNMPVLHSRQHFLKMQFPKTFRQLVELGIQHEYSMGYASQPGFRASICTPFPFYDVELEEEVPLMMHPFSVMEYTFTENLRLSPDESLEEMKKYIDVTKRYSGEMITVWHNRTFSEKDQAWKGWNRVYEEMIQEALQ